MTKLLLVGEAPASRGSGIVLGDAGGRLLAELAGITLDQLLASTDRINLLHQWPGPERGGGSAFPMSAGRAAFYAEVHSFAGRDVIFMGRAADVALSEHVQYFAWTEQVHGATRFRAARFPHPSGINRQWNSREIRQKAGAFLRLALAEHTEAER